MSRSVRANFVAHKGKANQSFPVRNLLDVGKRAARRDGDGTLREQRADREGGGPLSEKSDGEAGDALPSSATDVGGAVATGGEGSGVERG